MNLSLLKKMLPGLIPLLIFILADEIWGTMVGLCVALGFGIAEFLGFMLLKNRLMKRRYKNEEWFPVVNNEGRVIGKAPRSVCHDGKSMLLHPVVHLHIFNKSGKLFMQKRSINKDTQAGKWDTSVGGHISPGESVAGALIRETREELGLNGFTPKFLGSYVWESPRERELVNSFSTVTDLLPQINRDEIDEGRFWSLQEIRHNLGKEIFTPNFEHEFINLLSRSLKS